MSVYLNQILYNNTKFDTEDTIKLLEPYMHTKYIDDPMHLDTDVDSKTLVSHMSSIESVPQQSQVFDNQSTAHLHQPTPSISTISTILPKPTDTLFWCLYIAKYGYSDYLAIGTKYKNKEIETKQKMIETIKKSPAILKSTSRKVTNVAIQEIMAELMIDKKTTYKTFFAQCILNNLNMYIIDKPTTGTCCTYLKFAYCQDSNPTSYIIYKSVDGFFSIDIEEKTQEQINAIIEPLFELEHGERPIKTISAYKVTDLEIISKQLGLFVDTKKYKKQELYDEIMAKCQ